MIYLIELIKGMILAIGLVIGLVLFAAVSVQMLKGKKKYAAKDLVDPFEKYLKQIKNDERYEEIEQVEHIISELKEGNLVDDVWSFNIKTEMVFLLDGDYNSESIKIGKKYIVENRIEDEDE